MTTTITEITASNPRPTDTGVTGGIDFDVSIALDGRALTGEVTLAPGRDGDLEPYGDPDHWVSGALLAELRELPGDTFSRVLREVAAEAREVAHD